MTAPSHYLSTIFRSFSTFLKRQSLPAEQNLAAEAVLAEFIESKADLNQWEVAEVEQFLQYHPATDEIKQVISKFIQQQPPHQTSLYLREYLLALAEENCSSSTIRNYRSDINQFVRFAKENELKSLFTKPKLAEFAQYQLEKGLKESSITRKLSSICQFGLWADKVGVFDEAEPGQLHWLNEVRLENILPESSSTAAGQKAEVEAENQEDEAVEKAGEEAVEAEAQAEAKATTLEAAAQEKIKKIRDKKAQHSDREQQPTAAAAQFNTAHKANLFPHLFWHWLLPYLNLALVLLFLAGIGIFGYRQFFLEVPSQLAYPSQPTAPARVLSFQGRLTDQALNPVTSPTSMQFYLYDDETNSDNLLWDSFGCTVDPDQDGIFTVNLGDDCGGAIGEEVFTEYSNVWLEVKVDSELLAPRQPIRTVAYALNAETIQGYPIDASGAATVNTLLTMNSSGEVMLGEVSPKLRSVSGTFTLEGESLLLQTAPGTDGDIVLDPDGIGSVISKGYLEAPGATLSATYAGGVPLAVKGGPAGTGNLTEWMTSDGTVVSVVDKAGNIGIGTTNPTSRLDLAGGTLTFDTGETIYASSNELIFNANSRYKFPSNSGNFIFGSSTAGFSGSGGDIALRNNSPDITLIDNAASGKGFDLKLTSGDFIFESHENFNQQGQASRMIITNSGNVGIGTTSPNFLLDVAGTASVNSLNINDEYTFPTTDGTADYILKTDGNGVVSWADPASLGSQAQDIWATFTADSGTTTANTTTDTLSVVGAGNISTAIVGDTLTITGTDADNYVDSVSFNTTDGILTLGRTGALPDLTADLDGRYLTSFTETDPVWVAAEPNYFNLGQNEIVTGIPAFNGGTTGVSAPFTVDSTFLVSNLNADLLDGLSSADFLRANENDTFESGKTLTIAGDLDVNGDLAIADTDILFDGLSTNFNLTGDLSINTDDLFVEKTTGEVGIGTTTPGYLLDVAGDINTTTGTFRMAGTDYGQYFIDGAGTDGQVWTSDGTGRGVWETPVDEDNYVDSISFNTADGVLTVGRTGVLADLTADLDGRYLTSFTETDPVWVAAEPNYFNLTENETVTGIPAFNGGTTGVSAPFTVDSTFLVSNLNADLLDGQEGSYYMPASTDNWVNTTGDTMTGTLNFSGVASDITTATDEHLSLMPGGTGNVGIGTTSPGYKLDVAGTASVNSLNINDAYTFPTTDGTADYILKTDGNGVVSWADPASLGSQAQNIWATFTADTGTTTANTTTDTLSVVGAGSVSTAISGDTLTITGTDNDNYVDSVSFNTTDGILTLGRTGALPDLTADLDGRYLTSFTETDPVWVAAEPNYFNLTENETVTGIPAFNGGTTGVSAPFTVDSTFLVSNLNADLLDGQEGSYYMPASTDNWVNTTGDTMTGTLNFSGVASDITTATDEHLSLMPGGTGNVGIGTTSPGYKFTVVGGSTSLASAEWLYFGSAGTLYGSGSVTTLDAPNSGGSLRFNTQGSERMRLDKDGRLGIGTNAPTSKLHVSGAVTGKALAIFNETGNQDILTASASGLTRFRVDHDGYVHTQRLVDLANSDYYVDPAASGTSITTAGDVGVGTTSPSDRLHVDGDMRVTGAFKDSGNSAGASGDILTSTTTGTDWVSPSTITVGNATNASDADKLDGLDSLDFLRSNTTDSYTSGTLSFAASTILDINAGATLDVNGDLTIADTDITFDGASTNFTTTGDFSINTSQLFVEKNTGNIGLGTSAPGAKLHLTTASGELLRLAYDTDTYHGVSLDASGLLTWTPTGNGAFALQGNAGGRSLFQIDQLGTGDIFTASSSGTTRFVINNSGNVGIGTADPQAKLDIAGTTSTISNTSGDITLDAASNQISFSGDSLVNLLNIEASGQIKPGAFTVNPTAIGAGSIIYRSDLNELHYYNGSSWNTLGSSLWTNSFNALHAAGSLANVADLLVGGSSTASAKFRVDATSGYVYSQRFVDKANSAYFVDPAATEVSATLLGNVGIGTTAPGTKLDVAGDLRLGDAGGAYDILNTSAAAGAASGNLYWGNSALLTSGNIGSFGVSSVTNSDGTLNISPTIGDVVASLNLSNANTWTGAQDIQLDSNTAFAVRNSGGTGLLAMNTNTGLLSLQGLQSTATLGSELVTNGSFDTDLTGWTYGGGSDWTWDASGKALHATGNTTALTQDITTSSGTTYQVTVTTSRTAGYVNLTFGDTEGSYNLYSGTYTYFFKANGTSETLTFTPSSDFDGTVDSISVKAITATSSPVLAVNNSDGSVGLELRSGGAGLNNTFVGDGAGAYNTTGNYNSFLGYRAGYSNTTGFRNSFLGTWAGYSNTTGSYNSFLGYQAGYRNTTGSQNSFLGMQAGYSNTTGSQNSFLGMYAGFSNTTGYRNSFLGMQAGYNNTTGYNNSFLGTQAGFSNTTGYNNSFLGTQAGYDVAEGFSNTLIGYNTGRGITTGDKNTIIGANVTGLAADLSNNIILADGDGNVRVQVNGSGNVGIGTTAPQKSLHIEKDGTNNIIVRSTASHTDAKTVLQGLGIRHISMGAHSTNLYMHYADDSNTVKYVSWNGTAIDLAEWYRVGSENLDLNNAHTLEKGQVLCIDESDNSKAVSCSATNNQILGIYSTAPWSTMGIGNDVDYVNDQDLVEVALAGRVPTIVTTKDGQIIRGDFITASDIMGVGGALTSANQTVGKALESTTDWSDQTCTPVNSINEINWPADDGTNPTKPCYRLPDGTIVGKIMVLVNVSFSDPDIYLTDSGEIELLSEATQLGTQSYSLAHAERGSINRIGAFAEAVIANLRAGLIEAAEITTDSLAVAGEITTDSLAVATNNLTVAGQSIQDLIDARINEYLASRNISIEDATTSAQLSQIQLGADQISTISGETEYAQLEIDDVTGQTVASFDSQGNATLLGELNAKQVTADNIEANDLRANEATISSISSNQIAADQITATSSRMEQLEAKMAELEAVRAQTAEFVNATISGTLYASQIEGLEDQLATSLNNPSLLDKLLGKKDAATDSASIAQVFSLVEKSGYATDSATLANSALTSSNGDIALNASAAYIDDYFSVNGSGYIAEQLGVGQTILVGNSLAIGHNFIEHQPIDPDEPKIFHIQPSGTGSLSLMAGLMVLDEEGHVLIDGNIAVAGDVEVGQTLLTSMIKPRQFSDPLQVQLATISGQLDGEVAGIASGSSIIQESRFEFTNQDGDPTATISARGRGSFSGLSIDADDLTQASTQSAAISSTKSSGRAVLRSGRASLTINNSLITEDSLIYISPLGSTQNQVLYIKSQTGDDPSTTLTEGQFTVGFDQPINQDVSFNWWIVN